MNIIDIMMYFSMCLLVFGGIFMIVIKLRMNRNEPLFGWKRRQYLAEKRSGVTKTEANEEKTVDRSNQDSISQLLQVEDLEYGIIKRENNEYVMILHTEFVNFELLQNSEQLSILEGYQSVFKTINFPIQLLAQAVRQDFKKERQRMEGNLHDVNVYAQSYNHDVLNHIQIITEKEFRITLRLFYCVKYIYEPSKMAQLSKDQREQHINESIYARAEILRRALIKAKVHSRILSTLEAAEVLKRPLNRDRMILHDIESISTEGKLAPFVTMDINSLPDLENLLQSLEEWNKLNEVV